jgi:hypothetical protein
MRNFVHFLTPLGVPVEVIQPDYLGWTIGIRANTVDLRTHHEMT